MKALLLSAAIVTSAIITITLQAQDPSQQAAQAMRAGRFAEAETLYRSLIKQYPNDSRLYMNLGLAQHSGRKYKEAVDSFQIFLKQNSQPGPVHLLMGVAHLKLNKPCDAIAPLETARKWQANEQVLVELGDAYSGCNRYLDAAKTYTEVARLKPADPRLPRAAARAFWQARDYESAKPLFAQVQKQFASEPDFLYEYGDTLARLQGAETGLPYLEAAVDSAPTLVPARGALGRALMELDRAAESIPHLEAAAPTDATLLLPLSRAYRATGRTEDAARTEAEYRRKLSAK